MIRHCSRISHSEELRLNFRVVEGGVNVDGIWKKFTRRVFFDKVNKVQGLELTKKILENLSLVKDKDHPDLILSNFNCKMQFNFKCNNCHMEVEVVGVSGR